MPEQVLQSTTLAKVLSSSKAAGALRAVVPRTDKALLKVSRGWLNVGLLSTALIKTTGAKSGKVREITTHCMPAGHDLILVGSNWGRDFHPAWYHNMKAHPQVYVTYRGFKGDMIATELKGKERALMWERLVEYNPLYKQYEANTERTLPVIQLRRVQ